MHIHILQLKNVPKSNQYLSNFKEYLVEKTHIIISFIRLIFLYINKLDEKHFSVDFFIDVLTL